MEAYLQSFPLADMKELSSSAPRIIDLSHKVRESFINQSGEVRDGKFFNTPFSIQYIWQGSFIGRLVRLVVPVQEILGCSSQCCGTVTIYYGSGSGSGSDFWKVMVPVPVPVPTFEKFMVPVPVPVPVPTFEKVTVPVPVPAPYLEHKKQIFKNFFLKFCWLFT
jgi:hypothetical protein